MEKEIDVGADWWQLQQQLEYEQWLADQAGRAEYDSWLKKLDEQPDERKEMEYAAHE